MRLPLVPSLPGPDPRAALRWALGREPPTDDQSRAGSVERAAAPARSGDEGDAPALDPRLTTPPCRVDRATDADRNPVLTAADVTDRRHVTFVADPFVVRTGTDDGPSTGPYHCFFEVKRRDRHPLGGLRGTEPRFDIGHATSPDGRDWRYEGVVLPAERAEHTYPHVFAHDGDWLMVPSPAGRTPDELRVYRATEFPGGWELLDSALAGEVRIDPTPFRYDGTWFLVYQAPASADYAVRLRWSESLLGGEWREHPASPLFEPGGNDVAPGGRPLVRPGRGVVDLFFRRGDPGIVESWRVVDPSREEWPMYELPTSPVVAGSGTAGAWDERNVHHVDAGLAETTGSDVVLVDGQDADHRYRLGVARPREFSVDARATLDERRVHPGETAVLGAAATGDGPLAAPEAGWYRASVRPAVAGPDRFDVEVELTAGATARGSFGVAGEGDGCVTLGPVGLDAGARPVVRLRHDATRPVEVTGGELWLRGW